MTWSRYFTHDFWTAREFDRVDAEIRRRGRADRRTRMELRERVKELEDDLGHVALLTRALVDACLAKGLLTHDEVAALVMKLDAADGTVDGRLDVKRRRREPGR